MGIGEWCTLAQENKQHTSFILRDIELAQDDDRVVAFVSVDGLELRMGWMLDARRKDRFVILLMKLRISSPLTR